MELNCRIHDSVSASPAQPERKRLHLLLEFPHPELEAVVVEWKHHAPSVFIQLKSNPKEPLQFLKQEDGKVAYPAELSGRLQNFINPATARPFHEEACRADIVFSARAFTFLQPEPDLVLPAQSLWECRSEALAELKISSEAKPHV